MDRANGWQSTPGLSIEAGMSNVSTLVPTLWVMAGGAFGTATRFHLSRFLADLSHGNWPIATFAVNVIGGLAMGFLVGWLQTADGTSPTWRLFCGVGFLGGFTTFSAFSLEMANMVTDGAYWQASGYAFASVIVCLLAVFVGLIIAKQMI